MQICACVIETQRQTLTNCFSLVLLALWIYFFVVRYIHRFWNSLYFVNSSQITNPQSLPYCEFFHILSIRFSLFHSNDDKFFAFYEKNNKQKKRLFCNSTTHAIFFKNQKQTSICKKNCRAMIVQIESHTKQISLCFCLCCLIYGR